MTDKVPHFWTKLPARISRACLLPLCLGGCAAPMHLFGDRGASHSDQPSKIAEQQPRDHQIAQAEGAADGQPGAPSLSERLRIPESLP